MNNNKLITPEMEQDFQEIASLIKKAKSEALKHVNNELINLYWNVGRIIAEEYRLQVGKNDYYFDLLFYHRGLSCLVAFELKVTDFKPEYLGKIDFYIEALYRLVKKTNENPSVGILQCKSKDAELVKCALSRNVSPTLVAEYETKLINKKTLRNKLHEYFQLEVPTQ